MHSMDLSGPGSPGFLLYLSMHRPTQSACRLAHELPFCFASADSGSLASISSVAGVAGRPGPMMTLGSCERPPSSPVTAASVLLPLRASALRHGRNERPADERRGGNRGKNRRDRNGTHGDLLEMPTR